MVFLQGASWGLPRLLGWDTHQNLVQPDTLQQAVLDRLKEQLPKGSAWSLRPLDPNRIEDFQGYLLGIPHPALDSLYAFRSAGGVLYNLGQFKEISGLPDSLLERVRPYLKFPPAGLPASGRSRKHNPVGTDLNKATASELQVVSGIGPVLSRRIVRFRDALGGFLDASQLYDVYGLDPAVARRVIKTFPLTSLPEIERVSLNEGTVSQLAGLLYLTRDMAEAIVARRERLGPYQSLEELREVESIPRDKIDRIALYLRL